MYNRDVNSVKLKLLDITCNYLKNPIITTTTSHNKINPILAYNLIKEIAKHVELSSTLKGIEKSPINT